MTQTTREVDNGGGGGGGGEGCWWVTLKSDGGDPQLRDCIPSQCTGKPPAGHDTDSDNQLQTDTAAA